MRQHLNGLQDEGLYRGHAVLVWAQIPRALSKAVTLLTYILEVTLLNLDQNTDCFVGRGFPQSYQESAGILPQITTIS